MAKLFLSGGGHANKTKKLDKLFEKSMPKNKRLLYIPVAMPKEYLSYSECFDWIVKVYPNLGYKMIDVWADLNNRKWEMLLQYGAVYFGGGNTFYLLQHLRKSSFDKFLLKYVKHGGIVYGGSAGAIILGHDIKTASFGSDADENKVKLKELKGFNIVNGYSIQCHYTQNDDKEIFEYVKDNKVNVIGLPDETGLYVNGKIIQVIGDSNAVVFTNDSKIEYKQNSFIK